MRKSFWLGGTRLGAVAGPAAKMMLSGYPSTVYDRRLARHTFDVANHAAGGSKARETEVVWCNFQPLA
jgi:hypothetical protein